MKKTPLRMFIARLVLAFIHVIPVVFITTLCGSLGYFLYILYQTDPFVRNQINGLTVFLCLFSLLVFVFLLFPDFYNSLKDYATDTRKDKSDD